MLITVSTSLHPRITGLTRWVELLSDGVIELAPFPSRAITTSTAPSKTTSGQEEVPQGMLKVHRLPILHEKCGAGSDLSGLESDLAFSLSRRKGLVIKPFSLPPVDGDVDAQYAVNEGDHGKATKVDVDF